MAIVFTSPAIEVPFPKPMARLVEDECDERAVAETLKIRPGANFLYSGAVNHTRPRPACGGFHLSGDGERNRGGFQ